MERSRKSKPWSKLQPLRLTSRTSCRLNAKILAAISPVASSLKADRLNSKQTLQEDDSAPRPRPPILPPPLLHPPGRTSVCVCYAVSQAQHPLLYIHMPIGV